MSCRKNYYSFCKCNLVFSVQNSIFTCIWISVSSCWVLSELVAWEDKRLSLLISSKWVWYKQGHYSSVSIVTGYGLDGPGIKSWWGARFSAPVQTSLVCPPSLLYQRFPTCAPRSPKGSEGSGLRVHFPGALRPLQENKINKNWMKLKNKNCMDIAQLFRYLFTFPCYLSPLPPHNTTPEHH